MKLTTHPPSRSEVSNETSCISSLQCGLVLCARKNFNLAFLFPLSFPKQIMSCLCKNISPNLSTINHTLTGLGSKEGLRDQSSTTDHLSLFICCFVKPFKAKWLLRVQYHQYNIHKSHVLPTQYISVFCVDLKTNRLFPYTTLTDWFL